MRSALTGLLLAGLGLGFGLGFGVVGLPGLAPPVAAAATGVVAQENPNRPTASQPKAGEKFGDAPFDRPWSYNWVARPFIAITALFLGALALGFLIRWIGLGRRSA